MDENGACRIIITRDNRLQLTVYSRIAGTLLTVYQDSDQIQVLNYHDKTALQLSNNKKNRNRALEIVNLTGAEFRSIFWGREITTDKVGLRFLKDADKQILIRKDDPLSSQRVIIRKWLSYQGIRLPKTIDFEDRSRGISLKVVMTDVAPELSVELAPLHAPEGFKNAK